MLQTEFEFTLPKGYLDAHGNLHRRGMMRLAKAIDEIVPLRDPRVKANPAYSTVIVLARVITCLGALEEITPTIIEGLFACDLNYLHRFYLQINELEDESDNTTAQNLQSGLKSEELQGTISPG
ncbi:hypothetical protein [Leptolyngbya sp. FACHB-671]|uniref:hypothetical protein n=1 Tax=Leptolyngbya sp. FACHB-671 TaxID=2692812 RepID=UPI001F55075E|nr:hypothetical protein [Leptolyngbya sp. FACHB-671]